MEFKVTIQQVTPLGVDSDQDNTLEERIFDQFHDMIAYLTEVASHWNNFRPEQNIQINISKVNSDTETLGISVSDKFKISDLLR